MDDKHLGLYQKYIVKRIDGSSESGGKHENCNYFVIDINHDKHAGVALMAYSRSCYIDYPKLSEELRVIAAAGLISGIVPIED